MTPLFCQKSTQMPGTEKNRPATEKSQKRLNSIWKRIYPKPATFLEFLDQLNKELKLQDFFLNHLPYKGNQD